MKRLKRPRLRVIGLVLAPVLIVLAVDVFADAPLRKYIASKVNDTLVGYTVSIEDLDFHPLNFSLEVGELVIVQDAHPDPPIARFPRIGFNVEWSKLLLGRLVGDCELGSPTFYVNRIQLAQEARDEIDIEERGWQRALEAMYPLKINRLQVGGGSLTYIDDDADRPLTLSDTTLIAKNIRNVISPDQTYPSAVRLESRLFDNGHLRLDGQADFLAEPYPGILADIELDGVPLDRLDPVAENVRLDVAQGALTARGEIEWHPSRRRLHLAEARISGLRADYVYDPVRTQRNIEAAQRLERQSSVELQLDRLLIEGGEIGFFNQQAESDWRVFLSDGQVELLDYSNDPQGPAASLSARGLFMGSGDATLDAVFRSDVNGPNFDLAVAIERTDLSALNDLLRAHAGLDVRGGDFALFAELAVADGRLEGYVKPLFSNVNVYDPAQDRHKSVFRKMYEGIAEGIADLLENRKRGQVATVAELAGPLGDPKTSNLEVVLRLVENAFFESILPGFEQGLDKSADGQARQRRRQRREGKQD